VVVPSSEVSRLHAEIAPEPRGYVIRDLSTNGVWVNGVRVDDSQLLGRADIIRVGNEEFRFYADVVPAAKPAEITAAAPPLVVSPAARATPAATATVAPPAPVAPIAPSAPPKPRAQPAAPLPPVTPPPAPRPVLATLEIVSEGVLKGKRYEIRVPLVHIGRGPHNDVVVFDDSVSDAHAKLQKRDAGWFVVDMASTNGTYVAGQRVTGEQQLHGAPDIRVGGVKLVFHPTPESADQGKGTRAIAGMSAEQAQRMRAASAAPRTASVEGDAPATNGVSRGGVPAWIWIAVVVVVAAAAAAFFLFQSR
jgi:pSer/pThr/pTyr-binding forkhead associated (FHA) protein